MTAADGIILPQGCSKELYSLARTYCRHVFPDYEARFAYPGKTGQSRLFAEYEAPSPRQVVLENIAQYDDASTIFSYPFVVKGAWGGEGNNVLLISSRQELMASRDRVDGWLKKGGCVVQQYVPADGKSLRVVVIGDRFFPYWRINRNGEFYSNLARGGAVVSGDKSWPELQDRALEKLRSFCRATGINLAGFDFLFSLETVDPQPLFLEINYCFRTKGLGGPDVFLKLLEDGVRRWVEGLCLPSSSG